MALGATGGGFSTDKWGVGRRLPVPEGAYADQGRILMKYRSYGVLGLFGLLFLLIISGSWYTIDQTQRGVLLRNGAFIEVEQPGLHFKLPIIESVYKIDIQTHTRTYGSGQDVMEAYSADQKHHVPRGARQSTGNVQSLCGRHGSGGIAPYHAPHE